MGALKDMFLGEDDEPYYAPLFGWITAEVHAHDRTGCTGTDFVSGRWGGLVCTKCGK
jgi:hypothetical protein